jgi:Mg-chelatase subunit ChlD
MRKFPGMILRWRKVPCALLLLLLCASSRNRARAQQLQSSPPANSLVQVFLTATSDNGAPSALTESELRVLVDRKPASLNTLRSAKNDALMFALLVDISGSDANNAEWIRNAALGLFQGLATAGNQGHLVLVRDKVAISDTPLQVQQVQKVLNDTKFGGGTALYDAIEETCTQKLSHAGNPVNSRRVIVLISDGLDNASHIQHTKAEEVAERERVAVFSLVIHSSATRRGEQILQEISRDTGGQSIKGTAWPRARRLY